MEKNKIALVTGGNRGLGKDMAINLAKKGLDVILTYNNNKAEAEVVVETIKNLGQKAASLQLNVMERYGKRSKLVRVEGLVQCCLLMLFI